MKSVILLLVAVAPALATTGGRMLHNSATGIFLTTYQQPANIALTIETTSLSTGADTVLHVLSDGVQLAGNDDCWSTLPGCTGLRSYVSIPATPIARDLLIVVRAYQSYTAGTGILRITPAGGVPDDGHIWFAGTRVTLPSLRTGSHLYTVEEQAGSSDTVLLALNNTETAIAVDDDSFVGAMSAIHVPVPCTGCIVIVGSYDNYTAGNTTLVWDEDADFLDRDGDRLGDALELAIGTNTLLKDTDGDGLNDADELLGVDLGNAAQLLRLPYYGADPLQKDVFVEANWEVCARLSPTDGACGDLSQPPNPDTFRMDNPTAVWQAGMYAPEVRVHVDTGTVNTDPATLTIAGAWGGARRHPTPRTCGWLSTARKHYFHDAEINNRYDGQTGFGSCIITPASLLGHELGHNFGLQHGGNAPASYAPQCNPIYTSNMNYALLNQPGITFSRNEFAGLTLNPTSMNELTGAGTTDANKLAAIKNILQFRVGDGSAGWPLGSIDWNRDGMISSTPVRAAATWAYAGGGCEFTTFQRQTLWTGNQYSALKWVGSTSIGFQLFALTRRPDGLLESRYATNVPTNCGAHPDATCFANWLPPVDQTGTVIAGSSGSGAPALAAVGPFGGYQVVQRGAGTQSTQLLYSYQSPMPGQTAPITGDPAGVTDSVTTNGHFYAPMGGQLYRWAYVGGSGPSLPVLQHWSDGSVVTVRSGLGIGVTEGYDQEGSSNGHALLRRFFAAIPGPTGLIDVGWSSPGGDVWTKMGASQWKSHGDFVTAVQPAIAYEPFTPGSNAGDGRLYLAWNPTDGGAPLISETEGNDLSTGAVKRRLGFFQPATLLSNVWYNVSGNLTLLFDPAHDSNLRAMTLFVDGRMQFSPVADGIFNAPFTDSNDFAIIQGNAACSIGKAACQY